MKLLFLIASLFICGSVMGQSVDDIYKISFKNRASGTARSAAMGGAFTSLGADASSMNLNPAGLAMYRSSEISITPSLFSSRVTSTSYQDNMSSITAKSNMLSANMNNISAIFNVYNSRITAMRGFTLGISYYNDRYSKYSSQTESQATKISIGDYYSAQLYNIKPTSISNEGSIFPEKVYQDFSPGIWGAMMAYNNGLLEPLETDGKFSYRIAEKSFRGDDRVLPSQYVKSKISMDNFSFTAATNFGDILYFGVTMGARIFERKVESTYSEDAIRGNLGDLNHLSTFQSNTQSGSAFDFKLGATIEPINGLKIGVAYHLPTIMVLDDEYYTDMEVRYNNEAPYNQSSPYDPISYKIKSSPSLLAGISYCLPFAILSFDYQLSWYNKMEYREHDGGGFNNEITSMFRPTNSFMAGLEVQPLKGFFIRGGYAYYDSPYKSVDNHKFGVTNNISLGLGYKTKIFYLDLAYINSRYKTLPFKYFGGYFENPSDTNKNVFVASESDVEQKFSENTVSLTFGFRF